MKIKGDFIMTEDLNIEEKERIKLMLWVAKRVGLMEFFNITEEDLKLERKKNE